MADLHQESNFLDAVRPSYLGYQRMHQAKDDIWLNIPKLNEKETS